MPLTKCSSGGKSGWRWGQSGKCYTGPNSRKLALKQGFAEDPKHFKEEMSKASEQDEIDMWLAAEEMQEEMNYQSNPYLSSVKGYISKKQRDKIAKEDFAWPEAEKFPITTQEQVDSAAKLIGRAPKSKQASIKKRIIEIARRKKLTIPDSWENS